MKVWGKRMMWQQAPSIFFLCSPCDIYFFRPSKIFSEVSPIILVNRSCVLHFFDKGFNRALNEWVSARAFCESLVDFVSSLFIQNAYVSVFIKMIRACGYTHLERIYFDFLPRQMDLGIVVYRCKQLLVCLHRLCHFCIISYHYLSN